MKPLNQEYVEVELSKIQIGKIKNPREKFEGDAFEQFKSSIKEHGVLQPILLRKDKNGKLHLVAGERRFRASKQLAMQNGGLKDITIPAIIKDMTDDQSFDAMMAENLHRENLTDLEEAKAFRRVLDKNKGGGITQLAERNCVTEGYIRKRVRILDLPSTVLKKWDKGDYSFAHLEQFIRIEDPEERQTLIDAVDDWSYSAARVAGMIDNRAMLLNKARFKIDECKQCFDNSKKQKTLFDLDLEDTVKCLRISCFKEKQKEYLTKNLNRLAVYKKHKTRGFKFYEDVDYNDYHIFFKPKNVFSECKACNDYLTVFYTNGVVCDPAVCFNPKCHKQKVKAKATGKQTKSVSSAPPSNEPRVKWHGQHFREEFYENAIPETVKSVKLDSSILFLTAFSLLKSNYLFESWFFENYIKEDKAIKIKINDFFLNVETSMAAVLKKMSPKELKNLLKAASLQLIMDNRFLPSGRQVVADFLNINLKKEWRLTESYLKKKNMSEIIDIVKDFKLFKGDELDEFASLKKKDMIEKVLSLDAKLTGVVPKEILDTKMGAV